MKIQQIYLVWELFYIKFLIIPFGETSIQYGNVYTNKYEKDDFKIEFDKSIKNKDFIDLITKMIKLNPKNRLKWDEYFSHPFFK